MNIYSAYVEGRSILSKTDTPYRLFESTISRISRKRQGLLVNLESEIVIDGFPRSANTYSASYFEIAQERPVKMARHLHETYQFRFAVKHGIPCVLLIRAPKDAVLSAIMREPKLGAATLLRNYLRLYEAVYPLCDRLVVAPFEDVTQNANWMIKQVNAFYKTQFKTLPDVRHHKVRNEVLRKDRAEFGTSKLDPLRIAAPTQEKTQFKRALEAHLIRDHAALLREADMIYNQVLSVRSEYAERSDE